MQWEEGNELKLLRITEKDGYVRCLVIPDNGTEYKARLLDILKVSSKVEEYDVLTLNVFHNSEVSSEENKI